MHYISVQSLVYYMWKAGGVTYGEIVEMLTTWTNNPPSRNGYYSFGSRHLFCIIGDQLLIPPQLVSVSHLRHDLGHGVGERGGMGGTENLAWAPRCLPDRAPRVYDPERRGSDFCPALPFIPAAACLFATGSVVLFNPFAASKGIRP